VKLATNIYIPQSFFAYMNKIIKFLIISDLLILTSFGLIAPILSIFFKDNLVGGTILNAGLATTIFFLAKSVVQLPFSRFIDAHNSRIRLNWLICGSFLISAVPFLYIFVTSIYSIFFIQIIYGIGSGLAFPAWLGLWSTHLDKKKESFEWSLYSTVTGVGTAMAAAVGAALAQFIGFAYTFIVVGIASLIGCMVLLSLSYNKVELENNCYSNDQNNKKSIICKSRIQT
jgi:MFS family permease